MAFKEALSSQPLPAVLVHSVSTSPANFSRSWQFSTLHPMLGGKFVVSLHENALFVLDSRSGVVVGVSVFMDPIKSISTSGGFLYILSNVASKSTVLLRVAVHYSYVTTEREPWKLQITTPTSVNNSPLGSLESLVKGTVTPLHDQCARQDQSTAEKNNPHVVEAICPNDVSGQSEGDHVALPTVHEVFSAAITEPAMPQEELEEQVVSRSVQVLVSPCNEDLKTGDAEESPPVIHTVGSSEEDASVEHELNIEVDTGDLLKPTFGNTLLSVPQKGPLTPGVTDHQECSEEGGSTIVQFDDSNEQSRRLRMSQAAEDDIVANSKSHDSKSHDSKSHRKRRRRVKGKKLSSAASKCSVSFVWR